jgi:hypothetical protein
MDNFDEDLWWAQNGRPHTDEEMKWYRLWFEFLQLRQDDRVKWSEEVANDFGDVSGKFEDWWPEHSYLFRQMKHFTVKELVTDEDFQVYKDDGSMPDDPGAIILAVHLYEPKAALRAAFEEVLSKHHKGSAGRPKFDDWGDVYAFAARPDTDMLEKIIEVYRVYADDQKKPENERMKLWQIEEKVSEKTPLIDKTSEKRTYNWIDEHGGATVIESRRRSQLTTVKKYLNYAEEILENVVVGKFPVYSVSKSNTNIPPEAADK